MSFFERCQPEDEGFPSCRCSRQTLLDIMLSDENRQDEADEGDFRWLSKHVQGEVLFKVIKNYIRDS